MALYNTANRSLMNKPIIINISSSNHTPEKIDQSHIKDTSFKSGTIQGELHLCTWFWLLAQQLSYWSKSAEDYNTDGASWHQRVWDLIWHKGLTYTKLLLSRSFFWRTQLYWQKVSILRYTGKVFWFVINKL